VIWINPTADCFRSHCQLQGADTSSVCETVRVETPVRRPLGRRIPLSCPVGVECPQWGRGWLCLGSFLWRCYALASCIAHCQRHSVTKPPSAVKLLLLLMFMFQRRLIFVEPGHRWAHSPSSSRAPGIPYQGTMKTSVRMLKNLRRSLTVICVSLRVQACSWDCTTTTDTT